MSGLGEMHIIFPDLKGEFTELKSSRAQIVEQFRQHRGKLCEARDILHERSESLATESRRFEEGAKALDAEIIAMEALWETIDPDWRLNEFRRTKDAA